MGETISGSGGNPPKGTITAELIVKFFYGDFTPQGFKRYSGLWKGPPPGSIGKKDIKMGVEGLKAQMKNPMFVTKGGVGYGVDETQKVVDDGKGWVWIAAEMSPGGRSSSGEPLVRCQGRSLRPWHGLHRSGCTAKQGFARLGRGFGNCHCPIYLL